MCPIRCGTLLIPVLVRLVRTVCQNFDQDLKSIISRLERHARTADQTAVATELLQAAEFRAEARAKDERELFSQCEKKLRPADVENIHQQRISSRLDSTCDWILSNDTYKSWYDPVSVTSSDRILQISGMHGCGKSILASFIVSSLNQKKKSTLYFPFATSDPQRRTVENFVRNTLWQMLKQYPTVTTTHQTCKKICESRLSTSELWHTLSRTVASATHPIYLILDAIDECAHSEQLLQHLFQMVAECANLRVLLLGRPHILESLSLPLGWIKQKIEINMALVGEDVLRFAKNQVEGSAIIQRPDLQARVIDAIMEKADTMFLWVQLMIDDLRRSVSLSDMNEKLQSLPRGLEEAFQLILERISQKLGPSELLLVQQFLTLSSISSRPLTFNELNCAHALDLWRDRAQSNDSIEDFMLIQPPHRVAEICGGLIVVKEGSLNLIHSSVKDFLCRPLPSWSGMTHTGLGSFRVNVEHAHYSFAELCLDAIMTEMPRDAEFGAVIETRNQLQIPKPQCPLANYAYSHTFHHINRAGSLAPGLLTKISEILISPLAILWLENFVALVSEDPSLDVEIDEFQRWALSAKIDLGSIKIYESEAYREVLKSLNQCITEESHDLDLSITQTLDGLLSQDRNISEGGAGNTPQPDPATTAQVRSTSNRSVVPCENRKAACADAGKMASDIAMLLNQQANFSAAGQLKIVAKLGHALRLTRQIVDPLKMIFDLVLARASTLPVYMLMGILHFYWYFDKSENALEIGYAALKKVESREVVTKYVIHLMLGRSFYALSRYADAQMSFQQAQRGLEKLLGATHGLTRAAWYGSGLQLYELAQYEEAEECFRRANERGNGQRFTIFSEAEVLFELGKCLFRCDKFKEAEAVFLKSQKQKADCFTQNWLGCSQVELHEFEKARRNLEESYLTEKDKFGVKSRETLTATFNLGHCYYLLGNFARAQELLSESLSDLRTLHGTKASIVIRSQRYLACTAYLLGNEDTVPYEWKTSEGSHKARIDRFNENLVGFPCADYEKAIDRLADALKWCEENKKIGGKAIAIMCYDIAYHGYCHDSKGARKWLARALREAGSAFGPDDSFAREIRAQLNATFQEWKCRRTACEDRGDQIVVLTGSTDNEKAETQSCYAVPLLNGSEKPPPKLFRSWSASCEWSEQV